MVAELIVGVGMNEYVERTAIQREPAHHLGKMVRRKGDLITPLRMWAYRPLMKATHLHDIAKMCDHRFTKLLSCSATGGIEVDVCMPAPDKRYIEIRHSLPRFSW